mmetsp:Transcript_19398/g.42147  ORF Transcript_19398/g.42147 Transcript_19398/m.42147 type:complete len:707 (-) Transcript_19398:86-2206(-)
MAPLNKHEGTSKQFIKILPRKKYGHIKRYADENMSGNKNAITVEKEKRGQKESAQQRGISRDRRPSPRSSRPKARHTSESKVAEVWNRVTEYELSRITRSDNIPKIRFNMDYTDDDGAKESSALHLGSMVKKSQKKKDDQIAARQSTESTEKKPSDKISDKRTTEESASIKIVEGRIKKASDANCNRKESKADPTNRSSSKGVKKDPPGGAIKHPKESKDKSKSKGQKGTKSGSKDIGDYSKRKESRSRATRKDPRPSRSRRSKSLTKAKTVDAGDGSKSRRSKSMPHRSQRRVRQPKSLPSAKSFIYRPAFGGHGGVKGFSCRLMKSFGINHRETSNVHDKQINAKNGPSSLAASSRHSSCRKSHSSMSNIDASKNANKIDKCTSSSAESGSMKSRQSVANGSKSSTMHSKQEGKRPSSVKSEGARSSGNSSKAKGAAEDKSSRSASTHKSSKSAGNKNVSSKINSVRWVSKKKDDDILEKKETSSSKNSFTDSKELRRSMSFKKEVKREDVYVNKRGSNTRKNFQQVKSGMKNSQRKRISSQFHVRHPTLSTQQSVSRYQRPWQNYTRKTFGNNIMVKNLKDKQGRHSSSANQRLSKKASCSTTSSKVTRSSSSSGADTCSPSSRSSSSKSSRSPRSLVNKSSTSSSRRSSRTSSKSAYRLETLKNSSDDGGLHTLGISHEVSKLLDLTGTKTAFESPNCPILP